MTTGSSPTVTRWISLPDTAYEHLAEHWLRRHAEQPSAISRTTMYGRLCEALLRLRQCSNAMDAGTFRRTDPPAFEGADALHFARLTAIIKKQIPDRITAEDHIWNRQLTIGMYRWVTVRHLVLHGMDRSRAEEFVDQDLAEFNMDRLVLLSRTSRLFSVFCEQVTPSPFGSMMEDYLRLTGAGLPRTPSLDPLGGRNWREMGGATTSLEQIYRFLLDQGECGGDDCIGCPFAEQPHQDGPLHAAMRGEAGGPLPYHGEASRPTGYADSTIYGGMPPFMAGWGLGERASTPLPRERLYGASHRSWAAGSQSFSAESAGRTSSADPRSVANGPTRAYGPAVREVHLLSGVIVVVLEPKISGAVWEDAIRRLRPLFDQNGVKTLLFDDGILIGLRSELPGGAGGIGYDSRTFDSGVFMKRPDAERPQGVLSGAKMTLRAPGIEFSYRGAERPARRSVNWPVVVYAMIAVCIILGMIVQAFPG
jgi:hypothetical protein